MKRGEQLNNIVFLRGIAVMMVCFCHYGLPLSTDNYFAGLFEFFHNYGGEWGIHIFFVISGFIIPFSLWKGKYELQDYFKFLYKRVLRLHPPYLAALAITLVVMFFSYRVRNLPYPEDLSSIIKSIFYLHIPYDNPIFWSLAVEAQYYIFIGLFYVLLLYYPKVTSFVVIPVLMLLTQTQMATPISLLSYLVFFMMGTFAFLIYKNNERINWRDIFMLILIYAFAFVEYEFSTVSMSLATVLVILLLRNWSLSSSALFLGKISYSIYLIHFVLGIKMINVIKPYIDPSCSWLLFIVTVVVVIFISWIFYLCFEEFSEKLSKKVKYKNAVIKTV